jgi:hypothetical protein
MQYRLSDEQLKARLIDAYTDSDAGALIEELKSELYRRGYDRDEIITLAVIALLRRAHAGFKSSFSLN